MEVSLNFSLKYDIDLLEKGIILPIIRLIGVIEFKSHSGWSNPYDAIIDTGSPLSVFPASIQEKCDTHFIHQTRISGIVPHESCSLSAKLVKLTFRLRDKDNITKPIESKAYIAATDKIPLILGFTDVLEKFDLNISHSKKKAFLHLPD
jgi:hypothetical protein